MRSPLWKFVALAFTLAWCSTPSAWAWGDEGHRIVCRIAYLLLEPEEQDEVDRLTDLYRRPGGGKYDYFTEACIFADLARTKARNNVPGWDFFHRFNNWHYFNVPRDTQQVSDEHCGSDCVLEAIEYHADRLANDALEDWKRAEALFFLSHWVGDVHQPLHVSFKDDRGGNLITPIVGGYYSDADLHAVWDTGMVKKARGNQNWLQYAASLKSEITPTLRAQWAAIPLAWAQESYELTISEELDYCEWEVNDEGGLCRPEAHTRSLGSAYQQEFEDDVELRLKRAGARLADRIEEALDL